MLITFVDTGVVPYHVRTTLTSVSVVLLVWNPYCGFVLFFMRCSFSIVCFQTFSDCDLVQAAARLLPLFSRLK